MQSLLPEAADHVDLVEIYLRDMRATPGRPIVRLNMVSALDGTVALSGRARDVSGPPDRSLFFVLRSLSDLVLVGAGTARAENYGPVKLAEEAQQVRTARGQSRLPRVAVVTNRVDFDFGSRLFSGAGPRPIVIAPASTDVGRLDRARQVADVIATGTDAVDLPSALGTLNSQGFHHVLCEGGPTLNESLVASSLVDELCLTLSPKIAVGDGQGLVRGWLDGWPGAQRPGNARPAVANLMDLELVHVLEEDGFLFLRLRTS
jgi:riboflavin biosynthesis pyrimidine reductase